MSDPRSWLRLATDDLRVARWALEERIFHQACFHAQQCAEKCLKAWIRQRNEHVPRTHKLSVLVAQLDVEAMSDLELGLMLLDRFYIPTRYPDAVPGSLESNLPEAEDASEAVSVAESVLALVREHLELRD